MEKRGEENGFIALRAVQIDAALLDNSLILLLQAQINQILDTAHFLQHYKPLFHECITPLYYLSHLTGQTPGQRLLQIRSHFPTTLKALLNYVFCFLLPPFVALLVKLRLFDHKIQLWYNRVQTAYRLVDFVHFCLFLAQGGPIRPTERLFGARPIYIQKPTLGLLNFAALNRELIGHSFVHLCFLLVPLFNVFKRRLLLAIARRRQLSRQNANTNWTPTSKGAQLNGKISSATCGGIVWCTECGQTAIGAVRAKRRRRRQQRMDRPTPADDASASDEGGGGWKNYCQFCLFQSETFGNDGSQCQWEMLTLKNG